MAAPLRIDPEQRFACSQCGRCCHRFDVVVTAAEIDLYRKRNAQAWFRDSTPGTPGTSGTLDPFEAIPGLPALQRIRKRADGACGFLSADNRCRIHEELGAAKKPLTCRLYPYAFHAAADGVVVTASFGCPTIVANGGALISAGESLAGIESLRKEWFAFDRPHAAPLQLVHGRSMDTRSGRVLRESLLLMLKRDGDIRENVRRMAATIDDLTRSRVLGLSDQDFAEYLALTVPHRRQSGRAAGARARLDRAAPAIRVSLHRDGDSRRHRASGTIADRAAYDAPAVARAFPRPRTWTRASKGQGIEAPASKHQRSRDTSDRVPLPSIDPGDSRGHRATTCRRTRDCGVLPERSKSSCTDECRRGSQTSRSRNIQ